MYCYCIAKVYQKLILTSTVDEIAVNKTTKNLTSLFADFNPLIGQASQDDGLDFVNPLLIGQ